MKDWKLALVVGAVALGGVVVGAQCFGARPAEAQSRSFRRCVVARQESLDVNGAGQIDRIDMGHSVMVPSGWEVLGGGGQGGGSAGTYLGAVVLCER